MKNRLKFSFVFAVLLAVLYTAAAFAQQAPVKQAPIEPGAADKLSIRDCLSILVGLNALDGRKVIVAQGKPTESVEVVPYKFGTTVEKGATLRNSIARNLFVLTTVQQEAQSANRRAQQEIGKGSTIVPGSKEDAELGRRNEEYLERPCRVELDHLRVEDLKVAENDFPGSILALLWKITDRP